MKFFSAAVLISSLSSTAQGRTVFPNEDIYYHSKTIIGPSVWHFSEDGLAVYNPQGDLVKQPPKSESCPVYDSVDSRTNETSTVDSCRFFILASDGHRYVWAGGRSDTGDRMEMFDIDTADFVGYANTCSVPMDLSYHPGRREMLVHCHNNEMDVLSSETIGTDYPKVSLEYSSDFPAGRLLTHSTLGPNAYSAASTHPFLKEIDLSSRMVKAEYELPQSHGGRNLAYSPFNRHIFIRPRICCTCGTESSDAASCGRSTPEPVDIASGPSMGTGVEGICGSSCEGSKADTIGVWEFDTVSKTMVGSHNIDPAYGFGARPVASPDGRYIVLMGNDGGKTLRILAPGENGEPSTVATDIMVDFQGGLSASDVIADLAFVTDDNRNILVVGASTDNDIVLVDLNDNYRMTKLALTSSAESSEGNDRQIEWVVGTNYIWVTGGEAEELYVVELSSNGIDGAKVVKTVTGLPAGDILFVENYERRAAMAMLRKELGVGEGATTAAAFQSSNGKDDSPDSLSIVALALAGTACLVSILAFFTAVFPNSSQSSPSSAGGNKAGSDGGTDTEDIETKTLGSKAMA